MKKMSVGWEVSKEFRGAKLKDPRRTRRGLKVRIDSSTVSPSRWTRYLSLTSRRLWHVPVHTKKFLRCTMEQNFTFRVKAERGWVRQLSAVRAFSVSLAYCFQRMSAEVLWA